MNTSPTTAATASAAATDPAAAARRLWERLEVIHTVVYFAAEVAEAHRDIGLRGRIMSYTAARVAPLGPVGPEVAVATFYNFAPRVFDRALPDAWGFAAPGEVIDATTAAVGRVLAPLWQGHEQTVADAADLAAEAARLHPIVGRPLAAARAGLPWPQNPVQALWEAATRIRESRGDGHVACLVAEDLDGVACHLTLAGDSPKLRERLGPLRGWRDADFDAAAAALRARGLLADDGSLTEAGQALRARLERRTDELAAAPWQHLGEEATEQLASWLETLIGPVVEAGFLPSVVTRRVTG